MASKPAPGLVAGSSAKKAAGQSLDKSKRANLTSASEISQIYDF